MRSLCLSIALALLAACVRIQPPPATLDEIAQTVCKLRSQGMIHGLGVFVGFKEDDGERIFLLTARHVVTIDDVANTELHVDVGTNTNFTIRTARSRWDTTDREYDFAWLELNDDEKARLLKVNGLKYIPVSTNVLSATNVSFKGTGIADIKGLANVPAEKKTKAAIFYRGGVSSGEFAANSISMNTIHFPHNRKLKSCACPAFVCSCEAHIDEGDSGGPVFGLYKCGRKEYYLLTGLVNANSHIVNCRDFVTQPLDQVIRYIGYVHIKLAKDESLW